MWVFRYIVLCLRRVHFLFRQEMDERTDLRGANAALPRVKYALLRISRGAFTKVRNFAVRFFSRAEIETFSP